MAVFNEILAGRFNRALQKLFSMKGPPPTPQLASEIIPVFPLFNGVENRFLEGWARYGTTINITGGAAQFAAFRLRNPVGSGVMGVIESVILTSSSPSSVFNQNQTSTNPGDLGTIVGNIRLDSRIQQSGSTLVNSVQTTLASAIAPNTGQYILLSACFNIVTTENQEITISPGDTWTLGSNAAATNMIISLQWRERPLEDSEKTG